MHNKKLLARKIAITLAAGSILVSGQAFAQEEDFQLDQVVVTATRVAQEASSVPADVTVVTAQQIENKGARDLADALDGVPGVNVTRYGGHGETATVRIFGSDRVVVMVDGKRINIPQGIGTGASTFDLSTLPVADNIEKIEVVRGGGSVLYGSDAVGGVINIITKKGNGTTKTNIDVGAGNHTTQHYMLSNQGSENGYHWYITGMKDTTDGQRDNNDYDSKNATVRIDKDLNNKQSLSFNFDYYSSHAGIPGIMEPGYAPYVWNTSGSFTDFGNILRHNWSLEYDNKKENGNEIIRYYNNHQVYSGENSGSFYSENTVRSLEYQNSNKFDKQNLLTWGGNFTKEIVNSTGESAGDHDRNIWAGYVQDQYQWTPKLTMTTGLRYDHNSQYGAKTLPKVSFDYQKDKTTSYFASWGRVFNAPKFDDLYSPYTASTYWGHTYITLGNSSLKPETGWTAEVGVKKRIGSDSEATASLFKSYLDNAIRWTSTIVNSTTTQYTAENVDQLVSKGVNLAFTTKLSSVVTSDIGYTYLRSDDNTKYDNAGDPKNTFHLGINIKQGSFAQSIYGYYVDQCDTSDGVLPSHFTWNTNINYSFNDRQSIYLTINNIFNKKYEQVSGYPALERTIFFGVKQSL